MIVERLFGSRPRADISTSREFERLLLSAFGGESSTGISVNSESAMRAAAVFACVMVLSQSVGQLPCHLYYESEDGRTKIKAKKHRLYSLLADQPNEWMTSYDFWAMVMVHLCLRGNFYAFKVAVRNDVRELIPIHPDAVLKVEQDERYRLAYTVRRQSGKTDTIPGSHIMHLRGMMTNGLMGLNPIQYMRESIALALATEKHGAKLFANGARIGGILRHPARLSDEAYKRIIESFNAAYSGIENAHKTALIEEGMEFEKIGMTAEDSQFLESRKFQRSEIAGIFRVPPHMIADLEKATFSNIEHQDLGFVKHTLSPWLVNIEKAIKRDLLTPEEKRSMFAKFNVDALLRGDFKTRMEGHAKGIQWGLISPNEGREKEDMNPREGGDEYLRPLNMITGDEDRTGGSKNES